MKIHFYKYQGAGNDFLLIDHRESTWQELTMAQIQFLCNRHFGVGGDGLMLLNSSTSYDFEMKYYNSDGRESTMCGNGGRCITAFAQKLNIIQNHARFYAIDGVHEAFIDKHEGVRLQMRNVDGLDVYETYMQLNTGSPHYVHFTEFVQEVDMKKEGALIRYSPRFKDEGINVNFVEPIDDNTIYVRTYERGVEDETLSCGTGVTACALCFMKDKIGANKVNINTLGGDLMVEFNNLNGKQFEDVWLHGPVQFVFEGEIEIN